MPKKTEPELKARAVRLVTDHLAEYQNVTAASVAVAKELGVSRESVRRWVAQSQVDADAGPGISSEELEETKRLKTENRRLREDVAILKAAKSFLVGELDARNR